MPYKSEMEKGVKGAIANLEMKNLVSRTVEDADGIAFGLPVAQGANDKGIRKTQAGDTKFVGVTVLDSSARGVADDKFNQYESARIMKKGVIWVEVAEAVSAGDPVAITVATGAWATTVSGADTVVLEDAIYDTSADAGALAQLRLK